MAWYVEEFEITFLGTSMKHLRHATTTLMAVLYAGTEMNRIQSN